MVCVVRLFESNEKHSCCLKLETEFGQRLSLPRIDTRIYRDNCKLFNNRPNNHIKWTMCLNHMLTPHYWWTWPYSPIGIFLACLNLYDAGGQFGQYKIRARKLRMIETLANGYSSESTQQKLSNEYQHDRVMMVFNGQISLSFVRVKQD